MIGRPHIRADICERPSVGVDRGWLGSQAFGSASAFNANIGAWNTAAVTTLYQVCAAFSAAAARHRRRDALGIYIYMTDVFTKYVRVCLATSSCVCVRVRVCCAHARPKCRLINIATHRWDMYTLLHMHIIL